MEHDTRAKVNEALAEAFATRYPRLTEAERRRAADMVYAKIAEAIREGRHVSFFEFYTDGSVELSVLMLEEVVQHVRRT